MIVHEDSYRSYSPELIATAVSGMAAISARGNWAETLARYFAVDGTMEKREPHLQNMIEEQLGSRS
jgi:hypothetical protein